MQFKLFGRVKGRTYCVILESVRHPQAGPVAGVIIGHESAVDDTKAGPDSSGDRVECRGDGMTTVQSVQTRVKGLFDCSSGRIRGPNRESTVA
jgi:hypothetical protein